MSWSTVKFGKHKGKTLPQIVLTDPDWFFWAFGEEVFKSSPLASEAAEIYRRATRIKIPPALLPNSVVEYFIHPGVGKLADVRVVPADLPVHEGSSPTYRADYFDLSVPRRIAPYDKSGGKIIVDAIKQYVFGKKSARFTRKRCEQFFSDANNFA